MRLFQDFRHAFRHLARAPGFTCAVVVTLGLAIGANTALFSLVNAIVLRPLPVSNPDRLVRLQVTDAGGQNRVLFYSAFKELAALPVFETVVLYSGGVGFPVEVRGTVHEQTDAFIEASTPGFFEMLGLQPYLGRFFTIADAPPDRPSAAVAVISYDFWMRAFGGDPKAIGETIRIRTFPATVIGVTPREYKGLYIDSGYEFSLPLEFVNRHLGSNPKRGVRGLQGVARLANGVSLEQARASVQAIWPALRRETGPPDERAEIATQNIKVESLARGFSWLREDYRQPLLVVQAMSATLLLMACVNVGGLLLTRTVARRHQFAIQFALGASHRRIIRQLLAENVVLATIAALAAWPLAWWVTRAAGAWLWKGVTALTLPLTPDHRVLALTGGIVAAVSLFMSALPLWSVSRSRPQADLRPGRTVAQGSRGGNLLLVAQVAVSLVLLIGATLLVSSLSKLRSLNVGVNTEGLRTFELTAGRERNTAVYYPELVRQLSEVRGVRSVALAMYFPRFFSVGHLIQTQPVSRLEADDPAAAVPTIREIVTPRFFETTGMTILRGRDFSWSDDDKHPAVAIVNESLGRKLFPGGAEIGRSIRVGKDSSRGVAEIVGVVSDAAIGSYRLPHTPVVFRPRMQELQLAFGPSVVFRTSGEFRTGGDPAPVDSAITAAIVRLGRERALGGFWSLQEKIDRSLAQERLLAAVSSFFAVFAVLLAFVGVYSAIGYAVARRTREIGVRMALGASQSAVMRMVVGRAVVVTLLGIVIGVPSALVAGRWIRSLLFGLTPSDPLAIVAAASFFVVVGALAGLFPALRACRIDPATALRAE